MCTYPWDSRHAAEESHSRLLWDRGAGDDLASHQLDPLPGELCTGKYRHNRGCLIDNGGVEMDRLGETEWVDRVSTETEGVVRVTETEGLVKRTVHSRHIQS